MLMSPALPAACEQRVQDQIQAWCREGRWDRIAQEKCSVLSCMTQVLESCYTLLDSTQIPVDGIVRLLQHILRCAAQHLMQYLGAWQAAWWCQRIAGLR